MARISSVVAALLLALSAPAPRAAGWSERLDERTADDAIALWPVLARRMARLTIERYGRPDAVGEDALVWRGNGPWLRTTVHSRALTRRSYRRDVDFLENTVRYDVPRRLRADLARFDPGLSWNAALGELSSRAESEELTFLALNLADEIVKGVRDVDEALSVRERILRFSASGKASPYLRGLRFVSPTSPAP
ncbi:MAG: hypothetical protein NUW21_16395 [Elusimicrobia bacterium]|nr:hypothetical protein [Elusimicrobiota bacterium]